MFVQQDVEDEPAVLEKPSPAEVAPEVPPPIAKPTDAAPSASVVISHIEDDMAEDNDKPSPPYLTYAVIVLFMLTVPCTFYICGGPRLILLRRLVHRVRARGYRRVNVDDDLEK